MKLICLLAMFMSSFVGYAQLGLNKEDVTLKTTLRGDESAILRPSPLSDVFKFRFSPLSCDLDWVLYMTEYRFGKKIPYILEQLNYRRGEKGNRLVWEIIPDVTKLETLHLFVNIPGEMVHREKEVDKGKILRYKVYQSTDERIDEPTPLLLIFEDDFAEKNLKIVEKYTMQDSLLINSNNTLLKEIDHCYLVYYQLSKY
jgi:hypothetical protein